MSGRKQEVIDFLWPLQREGTWNEHEAVVWMSHYLHCGVGQCLNWSYFYRAVAAIWRQWRMGSLGSSLTFSSIYICTQMQVLCPQGSSKVFRTTNCSLGEKPTKNRIFFHSDIKT